MKAIQRALIVISFSLWAFSAAALPISSSDIVMVDGTEWVQPDLFLNLSWSDINTICPGGVCITGGTLNGYDVTGFQWASVNDMNALFNHYLASPEMGPGPDDYFEADSTWAPRFFESPTAWRNQGVSENANIVTGLTSERFAGRYAYTAFVIDNFGQRASDPMYTRYTAGLDDATDILGAWFYRGVDPQIPSPATYGLFGLALVGLVWTRRRKA